MLAVKKLVQPSPAFGMTLLMTLKLGEGDSPGEIGHTCMHTNGSLLSVVKFFWGIRKFPL